MKIKTDILSSEPEEKYQHKKEQSICIGNTNDHGKKEKQLRQAFNRRCVTLRKKAGLTEEEKIKLWEKLVRSYKSGFFCAYCNVKMVIKGGENAFSLEHPYNDYSSSAQDQIQIVCVGCNLFKKSISGFNFQKIISSLEKTEGMAFYQEIKTEAYAGMQNGLRRAVLRGKQNGRPKKKINITRAQKYLKRGIDPEEVARIENVSISTLRSRLQEANKPSGRG